MSDWDLQGYAGRWNRVLYPNWDGGPVAYSPGCFSWDPNSIELQFMHNASRPFGRGKELGLAVWQDREGLAFEVSALVPGTRYVKREILSILQGVAQGAYCECSMLSHIQKSSPTILGGVPCTLIERAHVSEITISPSGACPDTGAWLKGRANEPLSLPAKVRPVARAFHQALFAGVRQASPLVSAGASLGDCHVC